MNTYESHLLRNYRMSQDEYDALAQSQNYLCAVCREPNRIGRDGGRRKLNVDHSHFTGSNRGLLCDRCNIVLGRLKDSQELLLRFLFYLREHDGSAIPHIENNPETEAARNAAFEESLILPEEFATPANTLNNLEGAPTGPPEEPTAV